MNKTSTPVPTNLSGNQTAADNCCCSLPCSGLLSGSQAQLKLPVQTASLKARLGAPRPVVEESLYQTLHAVDTLQTIQIGKSNGRYYEGQLAYALTKVPKVGPTLAYMGAIAAGHALVTAERELVEHNAPTWAVRTWEVVTLGWSADSVQHNFSVGVKLRI